MYKVSTFNGSEETIIHYHAADKSAPHCLKLSLSEKVGEASNLSITLPIMNPGYNKIFDLITNVTVENLITNKTIFEGRVYNSQNVMDSSGIFHKDIICESELAYLNDSRTRIWTITDMSVNDFIQKILDNHNAHVTSDKQFILGNIEVTGGVTCTTEYENSLNCLLNKMVNILGGYLVVRKENGIRYLDYLLKYSGNSDDIILAKNMKDLNFQKDVQNIATRVIPLGKDNLTIETVNGGLDYIEDSAAVQEYGVIEQTVKFDDVTDPAELKTKGQAKLSDMTQATYKLSTNTLDLSTIRKDPKGFNIGTDTNIKCPVLGFNESFLIIQKDTDLLSPQNAKITLNDRQANILYNQVNMQRAAQYLDRILTSDKQVNTFYLKGYIDLLKNQMGAMADSAEKQQTKAILFEDRIPGSPTYGAMALGTQGFMIAAELINGEWDWRTFGTGKGFFADLIIAGKILSANGNVTFDLDNEFLKISHSDDSYTQMDGNGFKRHFQSQGKIVDYCCLNEVITDIGIAGGETKTITLPEEFKNRNFTVFPIIKRAISPQGHPFLIQLSLIADNYRNNVPSVDIANWLNWADTSLNVSFGDIDIDLVVIA